MAKQTTIGTKKASFSSFFCFFCFLFFFLFILENLLYSPLDNCIKQFRHHSLFFFFLFCFSKDAKLGWLGYCTRKGPARLASDLSQRKKIFWVLLVLII